MRSAWLATGPEAAGLALPDVCENAAGTVIHRKNNNRLDVIHGFSVNNLSCSVPSGDPSPVTYQREPKLMSAVSSRLVCEGFAARLQHSRSPCRSDRFKNFKEKETAWEIETIYDTYQKLL